MSLSAFLISTLAATVAAQGTTPAKTSAECNDVVVFYARGNDAPYHDDRVSGYISEICDKFEASSYSCDYIDIVYDASYGGDLCTQVAGGAASGISQITDFNSRCPDTKIVINGYSEGGNVVGDVLGGPGGCDGSSTGIDPDAPAGQAISAVTLFGDVRHTADQSYNVLDGAGSSGWARTGDDLARLNRYSDVLRSYCAASDPVCAGGDDVSYHLSYFELYSNEASDWIVSKVVPLLEQTAPTTSSAVVSFTSSAGVTSSVGSASTTSAVSSALNTTTSLHQSGYSTRNPNATYSAQPTPYSSSAVTLTLIDTNRTKTSASVGRPTGWNTTASTRPQPITSLVTITFGSDTSAPTSAPYVTVTDVVTHYTTVCPAESTYVSDGQQRTTTYDYDVTSTRVSTFWTIVTVTPSGSAETQHPGHYQPGRPSQGSPEHENQQYESEQSSTVNPTVAPSETVTAHTSVSEACKPAATSTVTITVTQRS